MKVSREVAARHRAALLESACALFRERGFEAVGVAEIAAAAGLTHGAFYTHFASKQALCAEAVGVMLAASESAMRSGGDVDDYVAFYLSPRHARDRAHGCPVAALGGDVPREPSDVRERFSAGLGRAIDAFAAARAKGRGGGVGREKAIADMSAMVGALILARAAAGGKLRDEILAATRKRLAGRQRSS